MTPLFGGPNTLAHNTGSETPSPKKRWGARATISPRATSPPSAPNTTALLRCGRQHGRPRPLRLQADLLREVHKPPLDGPLKPIDPAMRPPPPPIGGRATKISRPSGKNSRPPKNHEPQNSTGGAHSTSGPFLSTQHKTVLLAERRNPTRVSPISAQRFTYLNNQASRGANQTPRPLAPLETKPSLHTQRPGGTTDCAQHAGAPPSTTSSPPRR